MKIGIITAMPEESRAVAVSLGVAAETMLGTFRVGRFTLAGHDILLAASGVGFDNAAKVAESLVRDGRTELLISAGFCGGIAPELQVGDVVVATNIVIADEGSFEEIPVLFSDTGQTFVARQAAEGKRVVGGAFVSTPVISSKKLLAGMLSGRYPNPVVEMESGAIAIVAAKHNIPLLAIRAVSDGAAEELMFSLDEFCDLEMKRIVSHKVLLTALRRPLIIPQLVRLAFSSRKAANNLTTAIARLIPLL